MQKAESVPVPSAQSLATATTLAALVAAVVLVVAVLPAEYGVDPTGIGRALGLYRAPVSDTAAADAAALANAAPMASGGTRLTRSPVAYRSDEMSLTLKPGEGGEIKAVMAQGQHFVYTWSASGGPVDVDMHGEALDAKDAAAETSYWKDEEQAGDQGMFTAPIAGRHGWFWQNLNDDVVTVTVRTSGFYQGLVRP